MVLSSTSTYKSLLYILIVILIVYLTSGRVQTYQNGESVEIGPVPKSAFQYLTWVVMSTAESTKNDLIIAFSFLEGVINIKPPKSSSRKVHNFADKSSGARVITTSGGIISPSSSLTNNKDAYSSFPCTSTSINYSIVILLDEKALVEQISLKFMESYSNLIKDFELELSTKVDSQTDWKKAGKFQVSKNKGPLHIFQL